MTRCEQIQQQLAEQGPAPVADDLQLQQHLAECRQCSEFLEAVTALEIQLEAIPESDASDELVAKTLEAVEQADPPAVSGFDRYRLRWASGVAAVFVTVSFLGLWRSGLDQIVLPESPAPSDISISAAPPAEYDGFADHDVPESRMLFEPAEEAEPKVEQAPMLPALSSPRQLSNQIIIPETRGAESEERFNRSREQAIEALKALTADESSSGGSEQAAKRIREPLSQLAQNEIIRQTQPGPASGAFADNNQAAADTLHPADELGRVAVTGSRLAQVDIQGDRPATTVGRSDSEKTALWPATPAPSLRSEAEQLQRDSDYQYHNGSVLKEDRPLADLDHNPDSIDRADYRLTAPRRESQQGSDDVQLKADSDSGLSSAGQALAAQLQPDYSDQFLKQLDSLDDLTYQPATGYWANNYVPGDPAIRLLQSQLQQWDRTVLGDNLLLEQAAQPIWQPFDVPVDAALTTYLHSDKTHIDGPTRMRLQVGLQASERDSGQRPAMNLAVVLDLKADTGQQFDAEIRALLSALAEQKQPGDRFSLTIAGQPGGLLIPAGEFRHGPLTLAINQLFDPQTDNSAAELSLSDAIATARTDLFRETAGNTVLGSNLMLLVTGSPIGSQLDALRQQVHRNAVDGLLLSGISLGNRVIAGEVHSLVLAGQGNRRVLLNSNDAGRLIEQELYSASRAVARAIRLRIQLAPDVKLIQVHGSKRLDRDQIDQVKQAENSIDQRLQDNLGITADRGDDEAGIQIVIPSMAAGTSHVVLLDVVAERPGPIADVRVRYKDLTRLNNAVSNARLSLGNKQRTPGRLEQNVVKNLLALELAQTLSAASEKLAAGNINGTKADLYKMHRLISGLRHKISAWYSDADLLRDEAMLAEYQHVLNRKNINDPSKHRYLVDSLQLAAHRKLTGAIE